MDAESRVMLDTILSKPIGQMTETEKAVVRARRSYLTEAQCEDLAEVLEEKEEKGEVAEPKPKKGKK